MKRTDSLGCGRRRRHGAGNLAWVVALAAACQVAAEPAAPAGVGQVRVSTDPPGAVVTVDGRVCQAAPVTLTDLAPGEHLLAATLAGHREARRTIVVTPGARMAVDLRMEPVFGLILLHSSPTGATVKVDGADRGVTPLLLTDLPVGKHRASFAANGFLPKEIDLTVENRTPRRVEVNLASDSAVLTLDSTPSGADVTLNGIGRGRTPCTIDRIPAGGSKLELALPGYEPYARELRLEAGQTETVSAVLKPIPAQVTIVSDPKGARVYVNGQPRGEAPVVLDKLAPGTYGVRAELPGYAPLSRDVTVARAARNVEEFRLTCVSGAIELTTEPAGVKVLIDGQEAGVTAAKPGETDLISEPWMARLVAAGTHKVQLSRKGYYPKLLTVDIKALETATLHEALKRRFIADFEVKTAEGAVRGVLKEKDAQGNYKIETRPGIVESIAAKQVLSAGPVREEEP